MDERKVSIIVVPLSGGRTRERRFSVRTLRLAAILLGVVLLVVAAAVVWATRVHLQYLDYQTLRARNDELTRQVAKLSQLRDELERITRENERIRGMLGIEEEPPELQLEQLYSALGPDSVLPEDTVFVAARESLRLLAQGQPDHRIPSISPLANYVVSRTWDKTHPGIDLVAETGAPVAATADGRVRFAGWDTIYGNTVVVRHARGFETSYGHLLRIARVAGDSVRQGELVGLLGSTGRSTAPHLHYQVIKNRKPQDPKLYLP